ncbi:MAG: ANTAR domain-containing protein [Acidimicrobiales bacterium]
MPSAGDRRRDLDLDLPTGGSLRSTSDAELAKHVREVTSIPADTDVVDGVLRLVVALARATVAGADGVSVSLHRYGCLSTVAASDQTILDMDAGQYATGEGPCVDASLEGRWFHAESLDDETRWPEFVPRAKALGINAILSSPLVAADRSVGALNIYSRAVRPFGSKEQELAGVFAAEASVILTSTGAQVSEAELNLSLRQALRTREVVAMAKGVLMEREGLSEGAAYSLLRRRSVSSATQLRELASEVVASSRGEVPPGKGTTQ